jgi:hypothetical protein
MIRALLGMTSLLALTSCGHHATTAGDPLAHCTGLCADGPAFAVASLEFVGGDPQGHSRGFDLDGPNGDAASPDCAGQDWTDPEGNTGIDNQLGRLLPVLETFVGMALPTLVQNSINEGGLSILVEFVGLDDPSRKGALDLVFHHGTGTPLLGTDGKLLSGQSYALTTEPFLGVARNAHFVGDQIVAGPFDLKLPVSIFGVPYQLTLRDVHARLLPTVDMTSFTVLLGGSVVLSDIYALVDGIRNGPANLTNIVREVLPPYADIADPVTGECNRLSGTIEMSARQAFAYQK